MHQYPPDKWLYGFMLLVSTNFTFMLVNGNGLSSVGPKIYDLWGHELESLLPCPDIGFLLWLSLLFLGTKKYEDSKGLKKAGSFFIFSVIEQFFLAKTIQFTHRSPFTVNEELYPSKQNTFPVPVGRPIFRNYGARDRIIDSFIIDSVPLWSFLALHPFITSVFLLANTSASHLYWSPVVTFLVKRLQLSFLAEQQITKDAQKRCEIIPCPHVDDRVSNAASDRGFDMLSSRRFRAEETMDPEGIADSASVSSSGRPLDSQKVQATLNGEDEDDQNPSIAIEQPNQQNPHRLLYGREHKKEFRLWLSTFPALSVKEDGESQFVHIENAAERGSNWLESNQDLNLVQHVSRQNGATAISPAPPSQNR
ncbi:hypothetical protein C8J56DRAFT_1137816 [Mycena floridula]|nr:hypothetical protein C8J56DRAFT_1137816 [Mycena floridula]